MTEQKPVTRELKKEVQLRGWWHVLCSMYICKSNNHYAFYLLCPLLRILPGLQAKCLLCHPTAKGSSEKLERDPPATGRQAWVLQCVSSLEVKVIMWMIRDDEEYWWSQRWWNKIHKLPWLPHCEIIKVFYLIPLSCCSVNLIWTQ